MIAHREVQPVRCEKCNGTGKVVIDHVGVIGAQVIPCPHLRRADATGLSDDEERILDLERRLCETMAAVDRARDEGLEAALVVAEEHLWQQIVGEYNVCPDDDPALVDLRKAIRALKVDK